MNFQDPLPTFNLKIIFVNQVDGCSRDFIFSVPLITSTRELRLNQALDSTCQRISNLEGAQLIQVDFLNKMHIYLGEYPVERQVRISLQSIINQQVQINYRPCVKRQDNSYQCKIEEGSMCTQNKVIKNKKVKERTIQQALQAVKLWRRLYDTDDGNGRRVYTLDQAAKKVGVAKKTLDDYHSLIQTARRFQFNLQKYRQSKVGILRRFVKIAKEEGQIGINLKMYQYLYDMEIQKYWVNWSDL